MDSAFEPILFHSFFNRVKNHGVHMDSAFEPIHLFFHLSFYFLTCFLSIFIGHLVMLAYDDYIYTRSFPFITCVSVHLY